MEPTDLIDSDSSGCIPVETFSMGEVSPSYAASYLESFLPAYQMVNQSAISGLADRYRAIKFAADASLALVASGASWSDALRKTLVDVSDRNEDSSNEGNLSRSESWLSVTSEASGLSREQSSDLCSSYPCEPSGAGYTVSWGEKIDSLNRRNGVAGRPMSLLQRLAGRSASRNLSRYQRVSRDAGRLAILRSISSKFKSKRRLLRRSSKPRTVVRKVKSLAGRRRRLFARKPVQCVVESEERFEHGLVALQRLVPGGSGMDADVLLDEAADFVVFLKLQVQALQSVANAVGIDEQS